MTHETQIKKVIYEDIVNIHAYNNPEIIHYIVDYENGNYDYYIDIDIHFYAYNPLDDNMHKVYEEYIINGFFIYDINYNTMNNFIDTYGYLFTDDLIDDLYEIIDKMDEMQKL